MYENEAYFWKFLMSFKEYSIKLSRFYHTISFNDVPSYVTKFYSKVCSLSKIDEIDLNVIMKIKLFLKKIHLHFYGGTVW